MENAPIVVYSHLPWSAVSQRPHQLFSRIAASRRVIFFEETAPAEPQVPDSIELQYPLANLIVARPIFQDAGAPFDAERLGAIARRLVRWQYADRHVAWLYTPMAWELAAALSPERVIYDCMDQLFADVVPSSLALATREADLLEHADVVFADGPIRYRVGQELHARVLCLPSPANDEAWDDTAAAMLGALDEVSRPRPEIAVAGFEIRALDSAGAL